MCKELLQVNSKKTKKTDLKNRRNRHSTTENTNGKEEPEKMLHIITSQLRNGN